MTTFEGYNEVTLMGHKTLRGRIRCGSMVGTDRIRPCEFGNDGIDQQTSDRSNGNGSNRRQVTSSIRNEEAVRATIGIDWGSRGYYDRITLCYDRAICRNAPTAGRVIASTDDIICLPLDRNIRSAGR